MTIKPEGTRARVPLRWLIPVCLVVLAGTYLIRTNGWLIGRRTVEIVGPKVRSWASSEVSRLSEGAYLMTASEILVDEERQRVAIDTITVTTDSVANARRAVPLPALAMRFRNCALEGVDLVRLAAGGGLHIATVGCDSVAVQIEVPAGQSIVSEGTGASPNTFLNFQQQLDLPRTVPIIILDKISFPQLGLALGIAGRAGGRHTQIAFDRLGVQFDSLEYKRGKQTATDRVLLSRDVRVVLERLEGRDEASSHLALQRFSASLARGTVRLDSLAYQPVPGGFADSLGISALAVGHLGMSGVDWSRFLTSGDVLVGHLDLDSALIRIPKGHGTATNERPSGEPPPSLEVVLRAINRVVHLDSLTARSLTVIRDGARARDSTATMVEELSAKNLGFDNQEVTWQSPLPVGPLTVHAKGIVHKGSGERLRVASLDLDVQGANLIAEGVQSAPEGDDESFFKRNKYRADRLAVKAQRVELTGIDFPGFFRRNHYTAKRAEVGGFLIDLLSDKRLPPSPIARPPHHYPQQALRNLGIVLRVDSVLVSGITRYRERAEDADAAGVLEFNEVRAKVTNLRADPQGAPSGTPPLQLVFDARLMGAGNFHFDLTLPLVESTFQMRYAGSLSGMPAVRLNPFIGDALGLRFTEGEIEGITFDAIVTKGHAVGTLSPLWSGLKVELPNVAGGGGGLLGGIRRAVAKFAANTFVIRRDNTGTGAQSGQIFHRWVTTESPITFMWVGIREALLPILKK